ncbi:hypothetical protein LCGC14_2297270 [marine sediment metagenome]|uniref:Adenosylcobinamide kinase n=1 Tax=marine sediment metagenome TaxID=412755 RepID=A0A0F9F206_9ZZZZ
MRFLRRSLVGLLLLSITVAVLAMAGNVVMDALEERASRDAAPRTARERVFSANVIAITPETIAPIMSTFGEIRSRRSLEVRAPSAGAITEIGTGVEEGGTVREGQLLFRVDPTEKDTVLRLARTDLQDADAELRDARRALTLARDDLASAEAQAALLDALRGCAAQWIIVSNEVGQGIVPDNAMARQFREAQGRLNIALAAEAETVVQVVVGLPQLLKGEMP